MAREAKKQAILMPTMHASPDWIDLAIAERLGSGDCRFVFPSAVVAENRAFRALSLSCARALRLDRFMAWDELKEVLAAPDARRVAADDRIHALFAAHLMEENARAPFLAALIPPEHAAGSAAFAPWVAGRLAELGSLAQLSPGLAEDAALGDWRRVAGAYSAFLESRALYEPAWAPPSPRADGRRYAIFLPALIEDFASWEAVLADLPWIEVLSPPLESEPRALPFVERESPLAELRGALRAIAADLDSGIEAEGIALSLADLDGARPWLEREAELLGVPLDARSGKTLAASSAGRLFAALGEAARGGWTGDALVALLGSQALPWKRPQALRALLRRGTERHAVAPWPEGGRRRDPWEAALSGDAESLSLYRRLRDAAAAVVGARDFGAMLEAWMKFRGLHFEDASWEPGLDRVFARCVAEMRALEEAQALSGLSAADPYGLFLGRLEATVYVPADRRGGVRVFPWRLAAGAAFERHYLCGVSLQAAEVVYGRLGFLRDDLRERLGVADTDASGAFLSAYAAFAGKSWFSCPSEGFSGDQSPHGALLRARSIVPAPEGPEPRDAWRDEAAWLAGLGPAPDALHEPQARGLVAAARLGLARRRATLPGTLGAAAAAQAILRLRDTDAEPGRGLLRLDPSTLDELASCGFRALLSRILRVEAEAAGIDFADDRFLGEVYHAALESLWKRIAETDGAFRPQRRADYAEWLDAAIDSGYERSARRSGPFAQAVLDALRGRIAHYLGILLESEATAADGYFAGLPVGAVEASYATVFEDAGVALAGRLDRVSLRSGRAVIVDYKKSRLPRSVDIKPSSDEGGRTRLGAAQIPAYQALVEASGLELASAWYVSVEGDSSLASGSFRCALGDGDKAAVPPEELTALRQAFAEALAQAASDLRAGRYGVPPSAAQEQVCALCPIRPVCRERYAARLGDEASGSMGGAVREALHG